METNAMKFILSIDHGFSAVKYYTGLGEPEKFETLIAETVKPEESGNKLMGAQDVYLFEGKYYIVGPDAKYSGNIIHYRDVNFLLRYAPLLTAVAVERVVRKYRVPRENIIALSAGLPFSYVKEHGERLRERLRSFTVNGIEYNFQKVFINHQGVGAFADYLDWGQPSESERGYIWDIGENTMIMVSYAKRKVWQTGSEQYDKAGISRIYDIIRPEVKRRLEREPSAAEFRELLGGKSLKVYGQPVDCSDIVMSGVEAYLTDTFNKVMNSHGENFKVCDKVILVGGGAYILGNYISNTRMNGREHLFVVSPNHEFSNVKGYIKLRG